MKPHALQSHVTTLQTVRFREGCSSRRVPQLLATDTSLRALAHSLSRRALSRTQRHSSAHMQCDSARPLAYRRGACGETGPRRDHACAGPKRRDTTVLRILSCNGCCGHASPLRTRALGRAAQRKEFSIFFVRVRMSFIAICRCCSRPWLRWHAS